jgi:hypothetical protein
MRASLSKPLFALHDQFIRDVRETLCELLGDPDEASELAAAFLALMDGNLLLDLMDPSADKRDARRAGLRRVAELVMGSRLRP